MDVIKNENRNKMTNECHEIFMKPIVWEDQGFCPDDDCVARWNGYLAHVEQLDDSIWCAAVYEDREKREDEDGYERTIFHSTADSVGFYEAKSAKQHCEIIMKLKALEKVHKKILIAINRDMEKRQEAVNQLVAEAQAWGLYND